VVKKEKYMVIFCFVLLLITEQQKREQETPEETIDMTYPVEGGSDETDLKQQNDSGDTRCGGGVWDAG
jgi:hypothetical protein